MVNYEKFLGSLCGVFGVWDWEFLEGNLDWWENLIFVGFVGFRLYFLGNR